MIEGWTKNMEIISENGKDYLVTYVAKIDNTTIDANALFLDVQTEIAEILKNYNRKNHLKLSLLAGL